MENYPGTKEDGGRLARDAAIYAAGNIAVRAGSFVLVPLQTHWLSLGGYGALMTLYVTMQILLVVMSLGMRDAFLRFEKAARADDALGTLFGTSVVITCAGGALVTALSYFFFAPFFRVMLETSEVGSYIGVTNGAAIAFALCLHVTTYYRANNQPVRYLFAGIAGMALLLASSALFIVAMGWGVYGAMLAYLVTYGTIALAVFVDVILRAGFGFSTRLAGSLIRFGFPLVFAMFGKFIMGSSGIYFLNRFSGLESVAVYSLGTKFAQILDMVLLFPYQLAFAPYVFARLDHPGIKQEIARQITLFVFLCALISFALLLVSRPLIALAAPPEYAAAFLVTIVSVPSVQLKGLGIFGEVTLSIEHRTATIGYVIGASAVLCVALSYWLTPSFHWYGVVIAATLSYGLATTSLSLLSQRAFPLPIEWKALLYAVTILGWFLAVFFLLWNAAPLMFVSGAIGSLVVAAGVAHLGGVSSPRELRALYGMAYGKVFGTTQ